MTFFLLYMIVVSMDIKVYIYLIEWIHNLQNDSQLHETKTNFLRRLRSWGVIENIQECISTINEREWREIKLIYWNRGFLFIH